LRPSSSSEAPDPLTGQQDSAVSLPLVLLAFFFSGIAGILYEVVWVREFGLSFGNTIDSAALVTGVFMAGLGLGGWLGGILADAKDRGDARAGLRLYLGAEILIALLGLAISFTLPHLESISAWVSAYRETRPRWHVLTAGSYGLRYLIAAALIGPITILMGASLTFLMRCLVRNHMRVAGVRAGLLFGLNTAGAALGCLFADIAWIPQCGVWSTQIAAVLLNCVAAAAAFTAMRSATPAADAAPRAATERASPGPNPGDAARGAMAAIVLSGFAGMGLEILWFRFLTSALGQYRLVFSLLLFEILAGIGVGAAVAGLLGSAVARPRLLWAAAQVGIAVSTLTSFFLFDLGGIQEGIRRTLADTTGELGILTETWIHLGAIVRVVGVPAFLMGFAFPLANVLAQRDARSVGRKAGILYLGNTLGALAGSLVTGFLFLPALGMKWTALALVAAALLAAAPLLAPGRSGASRAGQWPGPRPGRRWPATLLGAGALLAVVECVVWARLPADYLILKSFRASARASLRDSINPSDIVAKSEGLIETVVIADIPERGRTLFTNGHIMSLTGYGAQRYMRAFVHLPLLHVDRPESVLVICFGVGNTANAASLHRSVKSIEVVDISKNILEHAPYFSATNGNVLDDPRVAVFVNDGRHHLQMQPPGRYDLVTLEPPPISFAGVGSLYSREFYALVKSRLKPGGFMSQWLPLRQVPAATVGAMVRAFVDVFPDALLANGDTGDFLLIGRKEAPLVLSPPDIAARLAAEPLVAQDLARYGMGTPIEILGAFAASGPYLAQSLQGRAPATDDLPMMEYGPIYRKRNDLPAGLIDVAGIGDWCPGCFPAGGPAAGLEDLPAYLGFMGQYYWRFASRADGVGARGAGPRLPWLLAAQDFDRVSARYAYLQRVRSGKS
jgi:predicted membrane-bound spermidine synthase